MLALADGSLVLAASDLTGQLACAHLAGQRLAVARGERGRPRPVDDPHAELVRERGEEHERAQLRRLSRQCGGHVDLSGAGVPGSRAELEAAAARTARAMREGAPLIYQAPLFDGRWQGRADFLRRVAIPSRLGDHSYEVLDTKLSRIVRPHVVHQLSLYNRLVGDVQGRHQAVAHVILGDGRTEPVTLGHYAALHRHAVRRVEALASGAPPATYPEPVAHCAICPLSLECAERRRADDHLSLVAFARRDQRDKLIGLGLGTVADLAGAPGELDPAPLSPAAWDLLRHQAALQVRARRTRRPTRRHLPPAAGAGYRRLPQPDPGDVFFDLEGDPHAAEGGLEYLWGWWAAGRYEHGWAHDPAAEKAALERFVDTVSTLRARHPGMHVYHYAAHEASKLRSLSVRHATREEEVDGLLRDHVLVDLFAVLRQALQVGEESYSLKRLERHHGFERRHTAVREGGGSIVAYERWRQTADGSLLEDIRAYNREDCLSTRSLRDWLVGDMRPEAERVLKADLGPGPREDGDGAPEPAWLPSVNDLVGRLTRGLPGDPARDDTDQAERRLLSHLLLYHRREGKPQWWRHFALRAMTPAELEHERDALGGLVPVAGAHPVPHGRSLDHAFTFPPQEFKLDLGQVMDPQTGEAHTLVRIEDDRIHLRRDARRPAPAPSALIPRRPIDPAPLRRSLVALAGALADGGRPSPAARSILRREPPRLVSGAPAPDAGSLIAATLGLRESHLAVQGPPGTGKTFLGARMVVAAMRAGMRVAVTAFSHAAIHNLLAMIERHAAETGFAFAGIYKGEGYAGPHGLVEACDDHRRVEEGAFDLVAGTAWLLSREQHRGRYGRLFIDEAGQLSLASAVAVAPAADSVVLLGDPQQLPQVTQANHPHGSGASVLEHLLGGRPTVAPGRGVLLEESWRMHPEVCAFVSELSYEGRLRSRPACARRRVDAPGALSGAGLRMRFVEHQGRSQASEEEARAIGAHCRELLAGGRVTGADGVTRDLVPSDIVVVAPYNLARRCIAMHVPPGVRVGTVDRFQGQEAPVVFFAMTSSSGEDVPRGLGFLFDRNRLNVAVSRAQCLAVVVASPRLLDADCRTLEAMRLVDGVCRFAEMARTVGPAAALLAR